MLLTKLRKFFECYYNENKDIEIYNEFSLQHELGIYLRTELPQYKVQFERNVNYFINDKNLKTVKHEIDIAVFNEKEKYAIELKYPRQGQYPVRMFKFVEDIKFMEELKEAGFNKTYVIAIVDKKQGRNFYSNSTSKNGGIYSYFRSDGNVLLNGSVSYPCLGKKANTGPLQINGSYKIQWEQFPRDLCGYILEI